MTGPGDALDVEHGTTLDALVSLHTLAGYPVPRKGHEPDGCAVCEAVADVVAGLSWGEL